LLSPGRILLSKALLATLAKVTGKPLQGLTGKIKMGMAISTFQYLTLDRLVVNPKVARRLPHSIACRYRALPVAEADGQITVVMADPANAAAREAVATALGAPPCVVGGDAQAIDALLQDVWPEMLRRSLNLLVCAHNSPIADKVSAFARALGDLIGAHVCYFKPLAGDDANCATVAQWVKQSGSDLVVWGEPDQSLGRRLLSGPAYRNTTKRIGASLLVARQPRWPLKRLLLIVRGEEMDNAALDWVVRLARPSGAVVTVLTVVPPMPAMYDRCARLQHRLDTLLTTDTSLGRQMRQAARWLVEWELEGTLRLRQGAPNQQIGLEVAEGDYDLLVVAARPYGRWRRWLTEGWVISLLRWIDRPLLIAKPIT
jgi:nucleotide-binding universal stress UspA family protein